MFFLNWLNNSIRITAIEVLMVCAVALGTLVRVIWNQTGSPWATLAALGAGFIGLAIVVLAQHFFPEKFPGFLNS